MWYESKKKNAGGTTVVANPSGTATADLTALQVGTDIYAIPTNNNGNTNLPYDYTINHNRIDKELLKYFLQRIKTVYSVDLSNEYYYVTLGYRNSWWDYSSYIESPLYTFYVPTSTAISNDTLNINFSTGKNFSNFELNNEDCYLQYANEVNAHVIIYTFLARTIGPQLDNGWDLGTSHAEVSNNKIFGDPTEHHIQNAHYDMYVQPSYPVYVSKQLYVTDSNNIKQPILVGSSENIFINLTDLNDISLSNLTNGQILKYNSTSQKWENANESGGGGSTVTWTQILQSGTKIATISINNVDYDVYAPAGGGGGGGHVILDDAGTSMNQETNLQFKGGYVTDDSTNGKTVVNVYRSMTRAEYNVLPLSQREGLIEITDEELYVDLIDTLIAGQQELTLSSPVISNSSTIDIYTDTFGINPIEVETIVTTTSEEVYQGYVETEAEIKGNVTASSILSENWQPWKAFLDETSDGWIGGANECWWQIELLESQMITKIEYYASDANRCTTPTKVEYSNDGINWIECDDITSSISSGLVTVVISDEVPARFWKLSFEVTSSSYYPLMQQTKLYKKDFIGAVHLTFHQQQENVKVKVRVFE